MIVVGKILALAWAGTQKTFNIVLWILMKLSKTVEKSPNGLVSSI